METLEKKKQVVLSYIHEAFEKFNGEAMPKLLTPGFHAHPWVKFGIPDGPEGMKQVLAMLGAAFSNAKVFVEDMLFSEDKVVVRYLFEADHTGDLMGIITTGKRVYLPGIFIARFEGNKLAEYWREEDMLGLIEQLKEAPASA